MAGGRKTYQKRRPTRRPVKRVETASKKRVHHSVRTDINNRKKRTDNKKFNFITKIGTVDFTFVFIVFVLLTFGLAILLSASTPAANSKMNGKSYYFFIRQLCGIGVGAVMMMFFTMVDYHAYKKFVPICFWVGVILLAVCRIPQIGAERNGAWRWLKTPFIQLQPSEFMKPLMAMYIAKLVTEGRNRFEKIDGLVPYLIIMGVIGCIMLFLQSHASGAIVLCSICVIITLVAGAKFRHYFTLLCCAVPLGYFYLMQDDMRMGRILSMVDPFRDTSGKSYQIVQSLIAIGTGGLFGKGLGQGVQKYGYLPEAYNDFIFAIVCEELGLVGALIIMALFAALIIRGIKIALEAPDAYGMLIVVGMMSQIAIQTIFNIAVVCSAIPNTGISLPFFSFGGTAIMVIVAEIGIILNVSRQSVRIRQIPQ